MGFSHLLMRLGLPNTSHLDARYPVLFTVSDSIGNEGNSKSILDLILYRSNAKLSVLSYQSIDSHILLSEKIGN